MTMFLTKSQKTRQIATVLRLAFEMIGVLLSLGIQTLFIGDASSNCINKTITTNLNLSTLIMYSTTELSKSTSNYHTISDLSTNQDFKETTGSLSTNQIENFFSKYKYLVVALIFSAAFLATQMLLLIGTKENEELVHQSQQQHKQQKSNLCRDLKLMFTFKPFLLLASAAVTSTLAVQVRTLTQIYFHITFGNFR
jgi:Na+/melibiose symporter-like transporter